MKSRSLNHLAAAALALAASAAAAQAPVPPPVPTTAPTPGPPAVVRPAPQRQTVVVLDDRAVKDQAPAPFLARVTDELAKLRGMSVVRFSEARKRLSPKADQALAGCGDDAGCLANAARGCAGDIVVTVRLTKREGVFFLALTRINALRPQISDDSGTLAGTDADALAAVSEGVVELFPDAEGR